MFEKLQQGLSTFFSANRLYVFAVLVAIIVILQLVNSYSDKFVTRDLMTSRESPASSLPVATAPAAPAAPATPAMDSSLSPSDLLPHDEHSQWGEFNAHSKSANTPDLLQAGYHIGLDTVGQTMRNANLQERSDPVIKKTMVCPWNQSTIEPDLARTPMEIGQH